MNIFFLDKNPKICAEYHCDKHVVKMILESAQMLSTAYQRHSGKEEKVYKPAYPKHPMTIWVGDSIQNFGWTLLLGNWLGCEFERRYNKMHKSMKIINYFIDFNLTWKDKLPKKNFTTPPLCMPDEFKCEDYIQAYRNYYINKKKSFAKFTHREVPEFMKDKPKEKDETKKDNERKQIK